MKIKNMKLMLLGLLAMVSTNVFAQHDPATIEVDGFEYTYKATALDEKGRSVNNIVYDLSTITWENGKKTVQTKEAKVVGVNASAADAEVATLAIPAEVTGDKGTYQVVEFGTKWWNASKMKNVTKLTTSLSIDITNFWKTLPGSAYSSFSALTSLAIVDASTSETPLTTDFDGSGCAFKATLTTLDLTKSRITAIADNGLKGYTALTGFDFTGITSIGESAFEGDYGISTLTIPASVITIGANAFKDMYYYDSEKEVEYGLTTLTINGVNRTGTKPNYKYTIPAAFQGNSKLTSVTVGSTTATKIDAYAFAATSNPAAPITTIDLSGATALTTITNAFPQGLKLTSVKLYGTKLTTLTKPVLDLSNSQRSLATITMPAGLTDAGFTQKFAGFMALEELDLSVTKVKNIPAGLFAIPAPEEGNVRHQLADASTAADCKKTIGGVDYAYSIKGCPSWSAIYYDPALTTVKLNAETETIGKNAFDGCVALATVTNLNQDKLTTIGISAFNMTALTEVDLSDAKNELFVAIPEKAFGNIPTLTTITLPAQITSIATAAFANDGAVTSINLQDLNGLLVLNPIFHEGVVTNGKGQTWYDPISGLDIASFAPEVAIPISSLTLPANLMVIMPGALQLLDISEIVIPASVQKIYPFALQGCIKLQTFEWNNAEDRTIWDTAFRGDDHLKSVKMVTKTPGSSITIATSGYWIADKSIDVIFKGNKKDVLTFTVNAEDYASLLAAGWTETNLHYCTLSTLGASTFKFNEVSKTGEYFYATYYNGDQATWFPAADFEVFGAVVEGSDVVLVAATAEEGFYKVQKYEPCIIRSKKQQADYDLKNADFNNISTMPTDNKLKYASASVKASRLNYQYKLGIKNGVVAFYRISSGWVSGVYIQAETPKDRLNIVVEGEATAINGIATQAAENNGAIYNLNGVRVKSAQKGIYIQNGKKFVK